MTHHCSYCDKPFAALRKDKQYCSHTCKQMAFFKRQDGTMGFTLPKRQVNETSNGQNVKQSSSPLPIDIEKLREELYAFAEASIENKLKELIQVQNVKEANLQNVKPNSVITELQTVNKESETPIEQTVKASSILLDRSDKKETQISKATSPTLTILTEEAVYVPIRCKWIDSLHEQINERGVDYWLHNNARKGGKSKWVSVHYLCLLECILTISDMKAVEWNNLAELCNAFIFLSNTSYYKELPNDYPYLKDIISLRDKLKSFCLETQDEEWVQFRLKFDDKIDLMLQRYELADSFSKISFNQLQLDFKNENDTQLYNTNPK
ncbi:MAG: hypothetical protein ACYDCN_00360 [Bacteroidia bacterium]